MKRGLILISFTVLFMPLLLVRAQAIHTLPTTEVYNVSCDLGCYPGHSGTDFATGEAKSVVASADGIVKKVFDNNVLNDPDLNPPNSCGNYIIINHGYHNNVKVETYYCHLKSGSFNVSGGQTVTRGQLLAKTGNSGTSTSPHLHFEVRHNGSPVDPYNSNNYLWTTNPPSLASAYTHSTRPGYYADGTACQPILDYHKPEHGQPYNNGGGKHVHDWGGITLQDFNSPKYGICQIVVDGTGNKAYLVHGAIGHFWFNNWGYRDYGAPASEEMTVTYSRGAYGNPGDQMVFQKFSKTGSSSFKTIVWNKDSKQVNHWPVGLFGIKKPVNAEVYVNENGNYIRWPNDYTLIPTGEWLADAGHPVFRVISPDGSTLDFGHTITEGNTQNPSISPPQANKGTFRLTVTTPNTTVNLNNQLWPDNGEWQLELGSYHLIVSKTNYQTYDETFQLNAGQTVERTITLNEVTPEPEPPEVNLDFSVSDDLLDFGTTETERLVGISRIDATTTVNWIASDDQWWIDYEPKNGTNDGIVTIKVDRTNLTPGTHYGFVSIVSSKGQWDIKILITIEDNSPEPEPDPPTEPINTSNSITFSSTTQDLKITGPILEKWPWACIGGGNNPLLWVRFSSGSKYKVPDGYEYFTLVNAHNGNNWYYHEKDGYVPKLSGVEWKSQGSQNWYYFKKTQDTSPDPDPPTDPDPDPPTDPEPDPPTQPTNLSGSIAYNNSNRKVTLRGEFFNAWQTMILESRNYDLALIYHTVNDGYECIIPTTHSRLNFRFGTNGNQWYYPNRDGCQLNVNGLKWNNGWYWLNKGVGKQMFNIQTDMPIEFSLFQNYPNPFNPTTTISYQIPKNCHVKLTIFDTLGRQIEILVNQEIEAGNHSITWNASHLPSGIYLYILQTREKVLKNKMLLVK